MWVLYFSLFFFFKQKTAYEMRISDWSSDVCSSDLTAPRKVASRTRLRNVLAPGTTRIDYIYDFGDYWEHELTVSDVRAGDPVTAYPRFIAGEREDRKSTRLNSSH